MLNYAGIRSDLICYVVDKNPSKQNMFLPGSRIPIKNLEYLRNNTPNFIIILPWNLSDEIIKELDGLKLRGTKVVKFIPDYTILN